MTTYKVHIYREMRLVFGGIEADTHEAAAAIARDKPTTDADAIDDCDGENLAALVDVQGDEEYEQTRIIDFEPEQQRIAARKLLDALKTSEGFVHWALDHGAEREATAAALEFIRTAIVEAEAAGIPAGPTTPGLVPTLELQAALSWLLDDFADAGEDRNPETGEEYDSVASGRAALARAKAAGIPEALDVSDRTITLAIAALAKATVAGILSPPIDPKLLSTLEAVLLYAENERDSLHEIWKRDGDAQVEAQLDRCDRALAQAYAIIKA